MPGPWAQPPPHPSGVWVPQLKASCDMMQPHKLRSGCWEDRGVRKHWRKPHWVPFSTSELDSSSNTRPWTLPELHSRFVCVLPHRSWLSTADLISWCYLEPTHHYRLVWQSLGSWLSLVNIMDLLYASCLATIGILTLLARPLPCLLCCHTQLPACPSLSSNPLCAPWQVG